MKIKILSSLQLTTHFKSLRKAKGWSQGDLGRKIGVTQSRVAQIESNPGLISVDQLIQILHILDANLIIELGRNTDLTSPSLKQQTALKLVRHTTYPTSSNKSSWSNMTTSNSQKSHKVSSQSTNVYRDSDAGRFIVKSHPAKNIKTKW